MSLETNNPGGATSQPERKKSSAKLPTILVLAIALGASGFWFYQHRNDQVKAGSASEANSAPKYTVHLDSFTVNLADPEENHFLRTTLDLGLDRPVGNGEKESSANTFPTARVRDAILSVLTVCKADPLLTPEGKEKLKHDLIQALQQKVPEIGARDVYFTEFLVQR